MGWRSLRMKFLAQILFLFRLYIQQSLNVHRATRPSICQSPNEENKNENLSQSVATNQIVKLCNGMHVWQHLLDVSQ